MGNKLRWKNYERNGPFDIFYMRLVYEEFINDANIQIHEIVDMYSFLKNIIFATDTEHLKGKCTYRKCYDETAFPADKIWVVDHGVGETPSLLCRDCMGDFGHNTEEHQTLYQFVKGEKREEALIGIRGIRARANPRALKRVVVEEYVEVENDEGEPVEKVIDWSSYGSTDYAKTAIINYYRGKGASKMDSELLAKGLIERWAMEAKKYRTMLDHVKDNLIHEFIQDDRLCSGTVVTAPVEEGKYDYYGRFPDVYWWVIGEGDDAKVEVSFSYLGG